MIENLVPENHLLRKIDKYIDFSFINEILSLTLPLVFHHSTPEKPSKIKGRVMWKPKT